MTLRREHYEDEHQDLRHEYARQQADDEYQALRNEAGCTDDCPEDCTCVQDLIEDRQERRALEMDFAASRGVR